MAADEARWLGAKARELVTAYAEAQARPLLCTFESVEILWDTVVAPQLHTLLTMQPCEGDAQVEPESVWHANQKVPR